MHRSPPMFILAQEITRHGSDAGSTKRSSGSKGGNSGGMTDSSRSSADYSGQRINRIISRCDSSSNSKSSSGSRVVARRPAVHDPPWATAPASSRVVCGLPVGGLRWAARRARSRKGARG